VRAQRIEVLRAAVAIADRVEEDLDVGKAGVPEEPPPELEELGVDGRARVPDNLHVELPELAVPAGLWPVVPEHRPGHREAYRLRPRLHAVLDVGSRDPGRRLRPEGPALRLLGPGHDPEELLLDDVGYRADAPLEDRALLDQRRRDLAIAVAGGELGREALESGPGRPLVGQLVAGTSRGPKGRHPATSRLSRGRARPR